MNNKIIILSYINTFIGSHIFKTTAIAINIWMFQNACGFYALNSTPRQTRCRRAPGDAYDTGNVWDLGDCIQPALSTESRLPYPDSPDAVALPYARMRMFLTPCCMHRALNRELPPKSDSVPSVYRQLGKILIPKAFLFWYKFHTNCV